MRLVIVAHALHVAGGQAVALNLINALFESLESGRDKLLLVLPDTPAYRALKLPYFAEARFIPVPLSIMGRLIFDEWLLPSIIRHWQAEVIFALGNFGVSRHSAVQLVLFHNAHRVYPELERGKPLLTRLRNRLVDWQIRRTLPKTDIVYCQTDTMMTRFKRIYGYQNRVGLLPNAVAACGFDKPVLCSFYRSIDNQLPATATTLLCLTRYYPHKNLDILLRTFLEYRSALQNVCIVFTLDERDGNGAQTFLKGIRSAGLGNQLVNVGPVAQENLPALYARSDALILPTLLESFSGTYVEAMQFGKTILTSDRDFAHEVCGPAAIYFDPLSTASVFNVIQQFHHDTALKTLGTRFGAAQLARRTRSWSESVNAVLNDIADLKATKATSDTATSATATSPVSRTTFSK